MNTTPYIGITDIVSRQQVELLKQQIPNGVNRRIHVGVMTSYKFVNGLPTKWADIWLKPYQQRSVFTDDNTVYNVLHYADYEQPALTQYGDIQTALWLAGPHVHAIQLDMIWPNPELLGWLRLNSTIEIILQVSSKAMSSYPNWQTYLTINQGLYDYILIDYGMGSGTTFDNSSLLHTIEIMLQYVPESRLAIAGGLGPNTYAKLLPIFDRYPNISVDAQSQLRPSGNALDPLSVEYASAYVGGVCSLLMK